MTSLFLRVVAGSIALLSVCAWAGPDGARPKSGGIVLGAKVEKHCARCHHQVAASSKTGDKCPFCGVIWGSESSPARAQAFTRRATPSVTAIVRPVSSTVSGRIKELDAAITAQDGSGLGQILAVNFVLLGKDGRVQLDSDRFLETAITDAVASSIARKSRVLSSRVADGEVVTTVRVFSKRYPPDAKPEYSTTYERQTWTTEGIAPRLRLIELVGPPRVAKGR